MAWHFDEVDQEVQITDNAALTLPDGDWTIGGWIKLDDNAGTQSQYWLSWGGFSAAPSLNWYVQEASHASANRMGLWIEDAGTDLINIFPAAEDVGTSTVWQHLLAVRTSGGLVTVYRNGSSFGTDTTAAFDAVDVSGNLFFGGRSVAPADRWFGGSLAEWAKWDRALSAGERAALVLGKRPWEFSESLKWYLPMKVGGAGGDYEDWGPSRLTVTNNGSTHANHSPTGLWTPRGRSMPAVVGAAAPGVAELFPAMQPQNELPNRPLLDAVPYP